MRTPIRKRPVSVVVTALAMLAAGCTSTEFSTSTEGNAGFLTIAFEIPEDQVASAVSGPNFSVRVDAGDQTIRITDAWLVLDDMEMRLSGGECVDSDMSDDGDDCFEAFLEPDVLRMPVNSQRIELGTIAIPAGTYDQLQFDLYPLQEDDEQLLANPETQFEVGASVSLIGSIEGPDGEGGTTTRPFDPALFGPDGTVEIPASGGLTIVAGERATVTIIADVASWFQGTDGGLIDPVDAQTDEELASVVRSNILESFSLR